MCHFSFRGIKSQEREREGGGKTPRGPCATAVGPPSGIPKGGRNTRRRRAATSAGAKSRGNTRRALDVPSERREQEQNTESAVPIHSSYSTAHPPPPPTTTPPTDRVRGLQPPTVAVESAGSNLMQSCSHCCTAALLT